MKIQAIGSRPTAQLSSALEAFESQFRYPLGADSWFRISHGDDYTRFFRAIGDARCFIATSGGQVVGTITSTICRLREPGGEFRRAAYISDLKVGPSTSGRTLLRLLRAATDWTLTEPTPAFCVVMDGTAKSPVSYTGRLRIPEFVELAKLVVLRIPSDLFVQIESEPAGKIKECDVDDARQRYSQLTSDCFATDGGRSSTRSRMQPIGLIARDGNACGVLEDTRRCKRLFRNDGAEMVTAHLSCCGYRSAESAAALIEAAMGRCLWLGIPALFVCLGSDDVRAILRLLAVERMIEAAATVFGYALHGPGKWSINTAEI